MSEMRGDPNCPMCHGTGWDGDGYSLTCTGCRPSIGDLMVDKTCDRKRDEQGRLEELGIEAKIEAKWDRVQRLLEEALDVIKSIEPNDRTPST